MKFTKTVGFFASLILFGLVAMPQTAHTDEDQDATALPIEDLRLFAEIFSMIKSDYVEPIDDATLLRDAVRGMLGGLDPHSSYLDPESFHEINIDTRGEFGGLGIEVTLEDGVIRVVAPLDGTPADRAGIQSGDLIIRLDGMTVKGNSLDSAVEQMRGEPGSEITLTIAREGVDQPFDVTLKRAVIQLHSARGELLEDRYGYVRVSQFQSGTSASLRRQLERLEEQIDGPLSGLVLDLRNNPGGVLNGAIEVSDLFLHDGVIVSTRGLTADADYTFSATGRDVLDGAPMVVLVNRGSASASEIVAGALQDHGRALIFGTKTFGKGSVQTILPMNNGAALKLTTARYYTPNDRSIQATGIEPDIVSRRLQFADAPMHAGTREADLAGHLENETTGADDAAEEGGGSERLQDRDFEVGEALNLLKG
ncbi:MAG: S41 family peptidase, partial [Arenicellales bacterium]